METLRLDELRWIPAAQNPLKQNRPAASDPQRLKMLQLATAGRPGFVVDSCELKRGQQSFTVATLRQLRANQPNIDLFLIVGGDSVASFPRWKQPGEILQLAKLSAVRRGGTPPIQYDVLSEFVEPDEMQAIRRREIAMPIIELSSSDVRDRLRVGRSIRYLVPAAIEAMIHAENLYREGTSEQ